MQENASLTRGLAILPGIYAFILFTVQLVVNRTTTTTTMVQLKKMKISPTDTITKSGNLLNILDVDSNYTFEMNCHLCSQVGYLWGLFLEFVKHLMAV
jgi:hypothetical protein